MERSEVDVELLDSDLFSTDDWYFWGLNRRQLVTAGATSGAVVGGALDVSLGGATFLLGSVIGAAVGGALDLVPVVNAAIRAQFPASRIVDFATGMQNEDFVDGLHLGPSGQQKRAIAAWRALSAATGETAAR